MQTPVAGTQSIIYHHPRNISERFAEEQDPALKKYFHRRPAPDEDWENAFFRSLYEADAALLLGGAYSTLVAGHLCIGRGIPILPIAAFGGVARKIWTYVARDPYLAKQANADQLTAWTDTSADSCMATLQNWLSDASEAKENKEAQFVAVTEMAKKYEQAVSRANVQRRASQVAAGAFVLFVGSLLFGLLIQTTGPSYTVAFVLGLIFAGVSGSSIRTLLPNSPPFSSLSTLVIGAAVGLVFKFAVSAPAICRSRFIPEQRHENHGSGTVPIYFSIDIRFYFRGWLRHCCRQIQACSGRSSGSSPPSAIGDR